MSRIPKPLLLVAIIAVTFGIVDISCKKSDDSSPSGPGQTGTAFLKGIVTDAADASGSPVAGATVETGSGSSVASGANGEFTLPVPPGTQVKVSVTKSGWSLNEMQVNVPDGLTKTVSVGLLTVGSTQPVAVSSGGSVASGGFTLNLPAGFVVPPAGGSGSVSVSVTGLDPTTTEVKALPGGLEAIDANGATKYLKPVSFAEYTVKDANGNTLQFNQSASSGANIELPIPQSMRGQPGFNTGDPIECYLYDPESGKWKTPVPGIIGPSTVDGTPVIKATIFHLSWYGGAPAVNQRGTISGSVKNSSGAGVPGVGVEAFPGGNTTTDAQGRYQVDAAPSSNVRVVATNISGTTFQTGEVNVFTGDSDTSSIAPDITLGASQQAQFSMDAYIYRFDSQGSGFDIAGANIYVESTGATVDNASVVLHHGALSDTLAPTGSGSYSLISPQLTLASGQVYTITIDLDRNGTVDANGQVRMVGGTMITSPANNSTVGSQFTAAWIDSATGLPGYSANYYLIFSGDSVYRYYLTTSTSKVIGNGVTDSSIYGYPQPNDPLPGGNYTMDIYGLNGPVDFLSISTPEPNISGQNITGYFYSYSFGTEISFVSTGQGATRPEAGRKTLPPEIRKMIARLPESIKKRIHISSR